MCNAGQGTSDAFFDDPSVLFVSTHQAGGWPGTGALKELGKGDGEGYTINLPLPGMPRRAVQCAVQGMGAPKEVGKGSGEGSRALPSCRCQACPAA